MKCAIFEENSPSCIVYFLFSSTLIPVSMTDGETVEGKNKWFFRIKKNCLWLKPATPDRLIPYSNMTWVCISIPQQTVEIKNKWFF